MPEQPNGTVTFLFTDIQDSTRLAQQHPTALPVLLERHNTLLRGEIEARQGFIFKIIGDAFCAAFSTASDALQAALAAQAALHREDWGEATVKVRMGIHSGAAQPQDGDYTGYLTLARVQRVMSSAYGGQILLSEASAELLREELPDQVSLRDMGEQSLKGFFKPEHLWQVVAPGLPGEFPPLKTLASIPNNLPVQLTGFIGRESELSEVQRLFENTRLLTLTGPGGTGKTRLSLQAAAQALDDYPDGAWLVELAPVTDPQLVLQSIAMALDVQEQPGRPLFDSLADYLHAKNILLILDNCEHLIDACAQAADRLLRSAPRLKILASSRESLGIGGETSFRVPSLSLPETGNMLSLLQVQQSEAVQLFVARARAALPGFELTEENSPAVAQVCNRLDGIPLAIELAAGRVKTMRVSQIASRLDDRFRLLTGGSRTALPRQQTLRALIDWSYDLLPMPEQAALRQLAVFAGGWSLEAAEFVLEIELIDSFEIIDLLAHLADKSMVVVERQASDAVRYRLLETIRQYARERLFESGEGVPARDRHLHYFLQLAEKGADNIYSPSALTWHTEFELELDNFRAAIEIGLERDPDAALRLANANTWSARANPAETRRWLSQSLSRVAALPDLEGEAARRRGSARGEALVKLGGTAIHQGDIQAGQSSIDEGIDLLRKFGDKRQLAMGLFGKGQASMAASDPIGAISPAVECLSLMQAVGYQPGVAAAMTLQAGATIESGGDFDTVRRSLEESIRISTAAGSPWGTAMSTLVLGRIERFHQNYTSARSHFERCLVLFSQMKDRITLNAVRSELAHVDRHEGHYDEAIQLYRQTILGWQELGARPALAHELECLALIAVAQGQPTRAARFFGAAEALRQSIGSHMSAFERVEYDQALTELHAQMDETDLQAAWSAGGLLTIDQAVELALGE